MERTNEYRNSHLAQSIANEQRDKSDGKITTVLALIAAVFMFVTFKMAFGH